MNNHVKNIYVEGIVKELLADAQNCLMYGDEHSELYYKGVMYGVNGILAVLAVYELETALKFIKARQKAVPNPENDFFQAMIDIENKYIPIIEQSIETEKKSKKSLFSKFFG